jgi:chemotaxis protein histidine kinase CheA
MVPSDIDREEVEKEISKLTESFSKKLPSRLNEIRRLYEELFDQASDNADNISKIHDIAHTLAGSSGTFGLEKVSASFRELANYISGNSLSFPPGADDEHSKIITDKIDAIEMSISEQLFK